MRLTKTAGWALGTAGLCVVLSAGSWFAVVDPARAAAAEAREATVTAQTANAQLEVRIQQLQRDFADLPQRQAELAAVRQALPEDVALAALLRQLQEQASDAGVVLDSVTADAPVAVVDPAATPVAPPADAEAQPSGEPSAPADPAAPAADPAAPAGAGTQAVLAAVPVVVTTTGDFAQTTLVLKNIQARMPRAFLVDSLGLAPASSGSAAEGEATTDDQGRITATITGRVFAFVDPAAVGFEDAGQPGTEPGDG